MDIISGNAIMLALRRCIVITVRTTDKSVSFWATQVEAQNIRNTLMTVLNTNDFEFRKCIPEKHFARECELTEVECLAMSTVWSAYVVECCKQLACCELGLYADEKNDFIEKFSDFMDSIGKMLANGPMHISAEKRFEPHEF